MGSRSAFAPILGFCLVASGGDDDGGSCDAAPAAEERNCSSTGGCPAISVAGDAPAGTLAATGILTHTEGATRGNWTIRASDIQP
ncbi:MAG: hypothetical protein ACRETF_03695 [Nevskiaceae bacterium]